MDSANHLGVNYGDRKITASRRCCSIHVEQTVDDVCLRHRHTRKEQKVRYIEAE